MGKEHFHVLTLPNDDQSFELDQAAANHVRARRLSAGQVLSVFTSDGKCAAIRLIEVNKRVVSAVREELTTQQDINIPEIHLVQALPKGLKLDDIVKMSTELGVAHIHLAISERTIARPKKNEISSRIQRWERIAISAAEVVGRSNIPTFYQPDALVEIAKRSSDDKKKSLRIVCWENASTPLIKLQTEIGNIEAIWIIIGPEGGLSENEIAALEKLGYKQCSIGPYVVRVETAVITALAQVHAWVNLQATLANPFANR